MNFLFRTRILAPVSLLIACSCKGSSPAAEDAASPHWDAAPASGISADVVSHASSQEASGAWDASRAGATERAVDVSALRKKNHARLDGDNSPVTMLQGGTPLELGARLCEAVVPKVPKETPVLLKPNLGGFDWFKDPKTHAGDDGVRGRITDPEFVRGVIRCLKARGHTRITVAEGWGATPQDWDKLVSVSGYLAMTNEEKVPLVAMDDDGVFDKSPEKPGKALALAGMERTNVPSLMMPKILWEHLDHGLFISLPKVKAHRYGVVSMAVKGMQGTVMLADAAPHFRQKWRMHKEISAALELEKKKDPGARKAYVASLEIFAKRISDVLEVEAPHVILAEGAPAMSGDGFQKLIPSEESVAIGGTNPVLVDIVGAKWLGLWNNDALAKELLGHKTSPLLEEAIARFSLAPDRLQVVGNGAVLVESQRQFHFYGMPGFELVGAASAVHPFNDGGSTPEAHAARLEGGLVIDGRANDASWAKASSVEFETDYRGVPRGIRTKVRFLYDASALYALWELEGANLFVDASKSVTDERQKLYEEDCVELFLVPDAARRTRYFEVEVGPLGHFLDIDVDKAKKSSNTGWSSGLEVKTTKDEARHRVTIEYAMRSPDVVSRLVPGARLPLGLYRIEGKAPRAYLAWSPPRTEKPNFHVPEAFGTLLIDP